ncbi:MAG: DUF4097 family beta strand repeat-containing protein [Marinilabiliaceae bacterium]
MKNISIILLLVLTGFSWNSCAQSLADQVNSRYEGIESVKVEGVFCDVTVEPGTTDEVLLEGEIRSTRRTDDYSIEVKKEGSQLVVWVDHPRNMIGSVKGFLVFRAPRDVSFDVENVSGNIDVSDNAASELSLKSVSGDVTVSGIEGKTKLQSVSGVIRASELGGPLTAKSVSGDQHLSGIKGFLTTGSTSGNVSVDMVEGQAEISTTSGNISGRNLLGGVSVKSTSGDANLDIVREKLTAKSVSGDVVFSDVTGVLDVRTTSGDQKGKKVMFTDESSFNAISGDIHVDYDNLEESLGFDLRSGSGDLSAGDMNADGNLKKSGGEFVIKGSTTSGDQKFL